MEFLLYVTPVAIAVIVIVFIIKRGRKLSRWSNSLHEEQKTITATLVKKEEITTAHSNGLRRNPGSIPFSSTTGRFTFETTDGEKLTFSVKGFDYGGVKEGERGQLTYQGTYYLSFKKEESI